MHPPDVEPIVDPASVEADSPERQALEAEPSTRCLNCGASLPGAYCPTCGQKNQPLRTPIHWFVLNTLAEYLGLDGRVWSSVSALLFRPGRLTQAYVRGQRERYVRPLRIYLTASVLFFLVLNVIDPLERIRASTENDSALGPTVTMTAERYLVRLDSLAAIEAEEDSTNAQRIVEAEAFQDSLRLAFLSDSTAGRFADPDTLQQAQHQIEEAERGVDEARDDYDDARGSTSDQRREWQREQVASFRPDSTIRPYDLATAAELVVKREDANFNVTDGPSWLLRGPAMRRLMNARTSAERADAGWALGRTMIGHLPTVIFLLLPLFALLMKMLYIRRGWYYAEHLVFALHVHAFIFAILTAGAVVWWIVGGIGYLVALSVLPSLLIPFYVVVATKRVYAQGWIKTLVKLYLLSWMYAYVLMAGTVAVAVLATVVG
ncbi:MAG: DUF3667 domain-containing protein [Bacteroidota bacterium]